MFHLRTIAAALTLGAALSAHAEFRTNDSWTGPDKNLHAGAGLAIGATVTLATGRPLYGFLAGSAFGVLKELSDSRHPGTHDCTAQDLAVTVMGAAVGAYTGGLFVTYYRGRTGVAIQRSF